MAAPNLLIAIDGGQTATKALAATREGEVLAAGRGGPSDHFHIEGGVEKNRRAIQGAIVSALAAAGSEAHQVVAVGLGLTGAPTGGQQNPIIESIVREVVEPVALSINPDYVTNLAGASGGRPGVVLIAGGGAISYGLTADGRSALAGGYGFLLGDEGSAFKIGIAAISAAARAQDRRGEPTALQAIVEQHFDIPTIRNIPRVVYNAGFSRDRISLLAPRVARAADQGDLAAIRILDEAGNELALTGLGVIRQLFSPGEPVDVYMTGGVFSAGHFLREPFRLALKEGWPTAEPKEPRFPPAVGGLILAARAIDVEVDEPWLSRVEASLPKVVS
jgi:N-acetylglucosamine kinase-like BadF-type ATPase